MRTLLIVGTLFTFVISPITAKAQESKPVVTPEALLSFQSDAAPGAVTAWIPGTNAVILPVNEVPLGDTTGKPKSDWIERIDTVTGERTQLVQGTQPILSPDGKQIAYLSNQSGASQVWVIDADGTNARQVTHAEGSFTGKNLCWSPDSSQIAYTADHPAPPDPDGEAAAKAGSASSVVVYDHGNGHLQWNDPPADIWILNLAVGSTRKLASMNGSVLVPMCWLPNGNLIVSTHRMFNTAVDNRRSSQDMMVSTKTGDISIIGDPEHGEAQSAIPSPDGKLIATAWCEYHGGYWHNWQAAITTADGGPIRVLKTSFKTAPMGWASDGKHLFIYKRDGAYDQILEMGLDGKLSDVAIHCPFQFLYTGMPACANDGRIAWIDKDPMARMQLVTASTKRPVPHVVCNFSSAADRFAMGDFEPVHWTNNAGIPCAGLLIKPVGYQPGKKYPLLTVIHGGPSGGLDLWMSVPGDSSNETWPMEAQMWAGKGYAVFYPEYQSSAYLGIDYFMKEHETHDMFSGDLDDITSGVKHLVDTGIADPDKLAVYGHSYGCYEVCWVITHSHLFKAAVAYEGIADFYTDEGGAYGTPTQAPMKWQLGGTPITNPSAYIKNSAIYYVKGVTTPTLFINGDKDAGAIDSQSIPRMYVGLKEQCIDTQYLFYKGEGHVAEKPENVRNLLYWYVNWVDTHLGFPATPDPTGDFNLADLEATAKSSKTADSGTKTAASSVQTVRLEPNRLFAH
jgi:dipeptidyl aminopeptidase/acylaminoacyl peptidase